MRSTTCLTICLGIAGALGLHAIDCTGQPPAAGTSDLPLAQTLAGHNQAVQGVAFSPDGALLASGSGDAAVKLWNVQAGKIRRTFSDHEKGVTSVAFSRDGRLLASGSEDKTIKLWDVDKLKLLQTLEGHAHAVMAVAFSPDGKTLASGAGEFGKAGELRLWDVPTGKLKQALEGHRDAVRAVAYAPDGKILASGSFDHTIKLWDPQTGELKRTLRGARTDQAVMALAFSPDGKTLASGDRANRVQLWDPETGELKRVLKGHVNDVWSLAFSSDGSTLASGSFEGSFKLWDARTGHVRRTQWPRERIFAIALSPDGKWLATGSDSRTVKLWDLQPAPVQVAAAPIRLGTREVALLKPGMFLLPGRFSSSPDGKRLAFTASRRQKHVVVADGKEGKEYDAVGQPIFSPDNRRLAYWARRGNKAIVIVDGVESKEYNGAGSGLVFSRDSKRVAFLAMRDSAPGQQKHFVVVDGKEGKEYDGIRGGDNITPEAFYFCPQSRRVAYAAFLRNQFLQRQEWFVVVDDKEGKPHEQITEMRFSPDGKRLAYVANQSLGKNVVDVEGKEGKEYHRIEGRTLQFSPDGSRLAYVTWDITPAPPRWKVVVDGAEHKEFAGIGNMSINPSAPQGTPRFSPDSKHVVYLAYQGKPRIVVDGVESKEYDFIPSDVVFAGPNSVLAWGMREHQLFRVELQILDNSASTSK